MFSALAQISQRRSCFLADVAAASIVPDSPNPYVLFHFCN